MNINNNLLILSVFPAVLLTYNTSSLSSSLDQSEFEVLHCRLGASGNEPPFPFETSGLSDAEPTHRWSIGEYVTITIPPIGNNKRCSRIVFKDVGGLVSQNHSQRLVIQINNEVVQSKQFTVQSPRQTIELPLPHDLSNPTFIGFSLPDACPPNKIDRNNKDARTLALAFGAVDVFFEKPQHSVVNMGTDNLQPLKLAHGFSVGETSHRWLTGKRAYLTLTSNHNGNRISQVTFDTVGFVSQNSDQLTQKLIVSGYGIQTREYIYNSHTPSHKVTVDIPWNIDGQIGLNFAVPSACKPSVLDANNLDGRELSISFTTADISYFKPSIMWVSDLIRDSKHYLNVANHLAIIGADRLHPYAQGLGSKVIIVDDGLDTRHPQLVNNLTADTQQNPISKRIDHGTHVCGIIQSIAPQAQMQFISAFSMDFVAALKKAAKSTGDVVNISLSIGDSTHNDIIIDNSEIEALEAIVRSGKVVFISFGNDWDKQNNIKNYARLYSKRLIDMVKNPRLMGRVRLVNNLSYEIEYDEILCASSNRAIVPCPFAFSGPGTNLYSSVSKQQYDVCTGTSMATAVVSGAYALLKSAIPGLRPEQYLHLLDHSARKYSRSGVKFDDSYGVGVVDVYAAFMLHFMTKK